MRLPIKKVMNSPLLFTLYMIKENPAYFWMNVLFTTVLIAQVIITGTFGVIGILFALAFQYNVLFFPIYLYAARNGLDYIRPLSGFTERNSMDVYLKNIHKYFFEYAFGILGGVVISIASLISFVFLIGALLLFYVWWKDGGGWYLFFGLLMLWLYLMSKYETLLGLSKGGHFGFWRPAYWIRMIAYGSIGVSLKVFIGFVVIMLPFGIYFYLLYNGYLGEAEGREFFIFHVLFGSALFSFCLTVYNLYQGAAILKLFKQVISTERM